jgi:lipopolysaccharide transport system permease protein
MATRASTATAPIPVSVNHPSRPWGFPDLGEVWAYRELLHSFIARELKARYKQTALGAAWAVLQPFLLMLSFSIFFGLLVPLPTDGVPFSVFIYVALVIWIYFANTLTRVGGCLLEQQGIMTKVYFPRLLIPVGAVLANLVDFAFAFVVLVAMMAYYHIAPTTAVLMAPVFLVLAMLTAFAAGIWLAALNVEYRDVQQIIPFLLQVWMFAIPVFYPAALVRPSWRFAYDMNPLAGIVEGFRWSLLGVGTKPGLPLVLSLGIVALILVSGLLYFHHVEDTFADVV